MAKKPGKDRSLEEIKQRVERSRYELGRDLSGLRYELDFPLKIRKSFQRQTVLWISAAVVLGLMFAMGPARKKKVYVDVKGEKKKTKEGILGAGLMLSLAKLAGSVIRPVLVSYATQKFKTRSAGAQSKRTW
jgi:hypothetical protein